MESSPCPVCQAYLLTRLLHTSTSRFPGDLTNVLVLLLHLLPHSQLHPLSRVSDPDIQLPEGQLPMCCPGGLQHTQDGSTQPLPVRHGGEVAATHRVSKSGTGSYSLESFVSHQEPQSVTSAAGQHLVPRGDSMPFFSLLSLTQTWTQTGKPVAGFSSIPSWPVSQLPNQAATIPTAARATFLRRSSRVGAGAVALCDLALLCPAGLPAAPPLQPH